MSNITRLSSKGQIIIPKHLRDAKQWQAGQEFVVEETQDGVLLKAKRSYPRTTLNEVAGSLRYDGTAKSIDEMNDAIKKGVRERMPDPKRGASR